MMYFVCKTIYYARYDKAVNNTWFCENLSFASKKRSKSDFFVEAPIFIVLLQKLQSVVTEIWAPICPLNCCPFKWFQLQSTLIINVLSSPLIHGNWANQKNSDCRRSSDVRRRVLVPRHADVKNETYGAVQYQHTRTVTKAIPWSYALMCRLGGMKSKWHTRRVQSGT